MTTRVLNELRGRRAATALAFLVASCASRAAPLALPAGHPADPETKSSVVAANELSPRAEAAPAPPVEDVARTYVCPMHADVTSPSPGTCPKCGMALVPARAAGTHAHEEKR